MSLLVLVHLSSSDRAACTGGSSMQRRQGAPRRLDTPGGVRLWSAASGQGARTRRRKGAWACNQPLVEPRRGNGAVLGWKGSGMAM